MIRVRFAPSPTGALHIGGARTALFNFVFARQKEGAFVLRIDDTDEERSLPEYEADIMSSLRWLGLEWDEGPDKGGNYGPYRQSERRDFHRKAAAFLVDTKRAYYDDGGAVRLRYAGERILVQDVVCGQCEFSSKSLGPEPVILRSDGTPTYHLASVSDDIEMKITHIIRGQDHLTNTAKHQLLFEALECAPPKFAHLPLILGQDGSKLSKRNSEGLISVQEFRGHGYLAQALINFLMLLGWSHPDAKEYLSLEDARASFQLERVKPTSAIFDIQRLKWLNGWWIRHLPIEVLAREALCFTGEYQKDILHRGEKFWQEALDGLREGLVLLNEVEEVARLLCSSEVELSAEAFSELCASEVRERRLRLLDCWLKFLSEVALEDSRDCYTREQFSRFKAYVRAQLGAEDPKFIFQTVRAAITGQLSGHELKSLVPFITRDVLIERAQAVKRKMSLVNNFE